jgi:transposase
MIGYVAGGLPGQRLLDRLSIAISDDTVLRRVRQKPAQAAVRPVRNLGVDDWAWRKGQDFGTILVDLDLHRVLDLLADRAVASFSHWLRQHAEIVTISRDRCGTYAEGASLGAPQAQQVADRFHLVLNLSAAMERLLEERSRQLVLPAVEAPPTESAVAPDTGAHAATPTPTRPTPSELRRQRRMERYDQVIALAKTGESQAAISRALRMERKTVRRWLRRGEFPERKPPHRPAPKVNQFAAYLEQRWNEGCHNATRLYQEIREKGYPGKRAMVARLVAGWRKSGKTIRPNVPERVSPRHAGILVTRPADQMTEEQQRLFDRISEQCPEVVNLRRIALAFRAALTADNSMRLRQWIEGAKRSEFGQVVRFRLRPAKGHLSCYGGCGHVMEQRSGRGANQPIEND